jgi:hypothetical protein
VQFLQGYEYKVYLKMQHKVLTLSAILLIFLGLSVIKAQNTIPASGGNISGSDGSVSYSVGQTVYTIISGNNGTAAQGVQQPYEISVVNGLEESGINLNISVYPNPTVDFLQLTIENENLKEFSYQLYNMDGKLLENKMITSNVTNITISNFLSATYFLKVIEGKLVVKAFKIIKN